MCLLDLGKREAWASIGSRRKAREEVTRRALHPCPLPHRLSPGDKQVKGAIFIREPMRLREVSVPLSSFKTQRGHLFGVQVIGCDRVGEGTGHQVGSGALLGSFKTSPWTWSATFLQDMAASESKQGEERGA